MNMKGWHNESQRHSLAARGIKTGNVPVKYRKKGYEVYVKGVYHGFTKDLEEAAIEAERLGGKVVSSTNRRKIIYHEDMFQLYEGHGRKEANIDILYAIHNKDQRDVIRVAEKHTDLGSTDTASREEIARYWNVVHPKDTFDYNLWYR